MNTQASQHPASSLTDQQVLERLAELVLQAKEERSDKEYAMMHLSLSEAADLARHWKQAQTAAVA